MLYYKMPRRVKGNKLSKVARRVKRTMKSKMKPAVRKTVKERKTVKARKPSTKKQTPWLQHINETFKELKQKDSKALWKDAMVVAAKTYNKKKALKPVSAVPSSQFETVTMPKKGLKPVSAVPSSQFETVTMPKKKSKMKKTKMNRRMKNRKMKRGGDDHMCGESP